MRYHFTLTRNQNKKDGQKQMLVRCEEIRTLMYCQWEYKIV